MAKKKKNTNLPRRCVVGTAEKKVKSGNNKGAKSERSPISARLVKLLALECESITEADTKINVSEHMDELFSKFPKIKLAWDEGRFLRNLQQLAATAVTIAEAEQSLGLEEGKLTEKLSCDAAIADIWNTARIECIVGIKNALVSQAKNGKPSAAKHIEGILKRELITGSADIRSISTNQLIELTGKTRQTIHDWYTKQGLPRNSDKSFDLCQFFRWFEDFNIKKITAGPGQSLDPLKTIKAQKLEVELSKQRGQLLPRDIVLAGQLARQQTLVNSFSRKGEDLAMLCHGLPTSKIAEILSRFFEDVRRQQCQLPEELQLPDDAAKKFGELLEELKPEGE